MAAEQVATIAAMQLTEDNLTEMIESGESGFRGFGGRNATAEGQDSSSGFGGGPGDLETMGEQFLIGAVVRLMQTKIGATPADLFEVVFEVVTDETGLSVEAIQAGLAEGRSLAEFVESNGGDVVAVRAALIEAFEALPNAADFDSVERADLWLNQGSAQE